MSGKPEEFFDDVNRWVDKMELLSKEALVEGIMDINRELVDATPFLTGHLRDSWFAQRDKLPRGISRQPNPLERMNFIARRLKPGETYYVANTAAYANRVEHGFVGTDSLGRKYNQAGRYFFAGVKNRMASIMNAAILRVFGGN